MRFQRLLLGTLFAVPLLPACSSAPPNEATGSTGQAVTSSDIMARAREWVADAVPYCGGVRGGADVICGGICQRPAAAWDSFRSDCSGFVSWAWQIMDDPDTATFVSDRSGSNGWTTIAIDSLQAGDAVVTDGHIKLFSSFSGSSAADILEEWDCNQVAREQVQGFSRSGNTLYFNGDSRPYHPIRRNALTSAPPPPPALPPEVVETAFQANTGSLWTTGSADTTNWGLGMRDGTSPSIAALSKGGYEVAFQANTTALWTVGTAGNRDWSLGMMPGTSPSITGLTNGGFEVAFQANTGNLWTVGDAGNRDWGLGMMSGTSPSIAGLANGGFEVAFEANTTSLWTVGDAGNKDWALGMMSGTSPSIAALASGGFEVAFEANTTSLWTVGDAGNKDWALGMMPGTSPSIAALRGGGFQATFQANTGTLWKAGNAGTGALDLGMKGGTSPSGT